MISEPVLEFSTADFIASTDFKAPEKNSRPVPTINQYRPSQHAINTRNSVIALSSPTLSTHSNSFRRDSTRLSVQTNLISSPNIGIGSPNIDRRNSSAVSVLFPVSANTTSPLAAPDHSKDPTQAAVAASTMAVATAALNVSTPKNPRASVSGNIAGPQSNNPPSRPNSAVISPTPTSINGPTLNEPLELFINTHTKSSKSSHLNTMSPVSPLSRTAPNFDSIADRRSIVESAIEAEQASTSDMSPSDLRVKLQDSEQRAIDILIEYQQKLDRARKKIMELEKKLQEENKVKRQLSAQAAKATAAAAVAKSSIFNIALPISPNSQDPNTAHTNNAVLPGSTTNTTVAQTFPEPEITPATFLKNAVAAAGGDRNGPGAGLPAGFSAPNITPEVHLAKMSNDQLQARVTSLETQRETLRAALKSLRTAKDVETKRYQVQITRLKKHGAYQEYINQHQSAMLYYGNGNTVSSPTATSESETPVPQTFPSPPLEPISNSNSFGSLPPVSVSASPKLNVQGSNGLGMSLSNNSGASLAKSESRLKLRRTGTTISPLFPTSYAANLSPNSPMVLATSPSPGGQRASGHKHRRSRSMFSGPMGLGLSAPAISSPQAGGGSFRDLNLYNNIKDEDNASEANSADDITPKVITESATDAPESEETKVDEDDESNIEREDPSHPFPSSNDSSVTDSPDFNSNTFDASSPVSRSTDLTEDSGQINSASSSPNPNTYQMVRKNSVSSVNSKSSVRGLIARYSIVAHSPQSATSNHSPQSSSSTVTVSSGLESTSRKTGRPSSVYMENVPVTIPTTHYERSPEFIKPQSPVITSESAFPGAHPGGHHVSRNSISNLSGVNVRASINEYSAAITSPSSVSLATSSSLKLSSSGAPEMIHHHGNMTRVSRGSSGSTTISTMSAASTSATTDSDMTDLDMIMDNTASTNTSMSVDLMDDTSSKHEVGVVDAEDAANEENITGIVGQVEAFKYDHEDFKHRLGMKHPDSKEKGNIIKVRSQQVQASIYALNN